MRCTLELTLHFYVKLCYLLLACAQFWLLLVFYYIHSDFKYLYSSFFVCCLSASKGAFAALSSCHLWQLFPLGLQHQAECYLLWIKFELPSWICDPMVSQERVMRYRVSWSERGGGKYQPALNKAKHKFFAEEQQTCSRKINEIPFRPLTWRHFDAANKSPSERRKKRMKMYFV